MELYRFITGPDDASFCKRVSDALNKGWVLHGSASLTFDAAKGQVVCGQAIVKTVEGETFDPEMKLSDY